MSLAEHLALPLGPVVVAVEHLCAVVVPVPLRVHLDLVVRLVLYRSLVFEADGGSLVSDPGEVLP